MVLLLNIWEEQCMEEFINRVILKQIRKDLGRIHLL